MLQHVKILTPLLISLTLIGCSSLKQSDEKLEIKTSSQEKIQLNIENPDELKLRKVVWSVIKVGESESEISHKVFFAITPDNFKNLSLNLMDVLVYVRQLQNTLNIYREYYEPNTD